MVSIAIAPCARARVLGFRVALAELWVSVEDPDALVTALAPG